MNLKGKKVLVTGADGFIGSHLVERLHSQGASVRALSVYNSFNSWGWLEDVQCKGDIEIISGDIRDAYFCRNLCKDVDVIFHLAALIAIPYSYVAPESYIETNVKGTLNICQAALEHGVEKVIHTSTSEVYGSALYVPIDEKHPLQPQSPYSASKVGADAIAKSFFYTFNLPVVVARPFNTYGPRQSARAIIPTLISQIASGKKVIQVGDLTPTRDFNFVMDTCQGLIELCISDSTAGQEINIGSNTEISMENLFHKIRDLMKADVKFEKDPARIRPSGSEVTRLWCDNSKIKRIAKYDPEYDLVRGLQITIDWFNKTANQNKYKTDIYNV